MGHDLEPSILIGGCATFVRVGGEISLDIDLVTSQESRHKLEQLMTDGTAPTSVDSSRPQSPVPLQR